MAQRVTAEEVLRLLVDGITRVLPGGERAGLAPSDWRALRFGEDLHADSLDLVEVVEGAERALGRRGVTVHIADADLVNLRTVGDAADALTTLASQEASA
jgi:acyl carrier protein